METWQILVRSLLQNAYLIVTSLDQAPTGVLMLRLVSSLQRRGQTVYVLSIGGGVPALYHRRESKSLSAGADQKHGCGLT